MGKGGPGAANSVGPSPPEFDLAFRHRLEDLFVWRRDVRSFRADLLPPGTLDRLIALACLAPSVGYSQPWRFVLVNDRDRRRRVRDIFDACNRDALGDYAGETARSYAALKLAGLDEAPCHLAVFADPHGSAGRGLGRRTMPETAEYSVVTAIHTLWLAARAEGLGVGWVSILDPVAVSVALEVPMAWRLVAYLCIGFAQQEQPVPELERLEWEKRQTVEKIVHYR